MNTVKNYDAAVRSISKSVRPFLENMPETIKKETYEIRLRSMRPVTLCGAYGIKFINKNGAFSDYNDEVIISSAEDIKDTFNRICSYSIYSFQRFINSGYIPLEGGNRAGFCGTAVCEGKNITAVKDVTSINIRISKEVFGCADEILCRMGNISGSFIIAGPPASGKTTVIRDIARQISSGRNGKYIKTAVIDERREISGAIGGILTNDVGITTDVFDSYPKSEAIDIAVRTLTPEVIICDEISTEYEIDAVRNGINCGAKFIVTVHAGSEEELLFRKQIEELLLLYSFEKVFLLSGKDKGRIIREYNAGELLNEISFRRIGCSNNNVCGIL